MSWLQDFFTGIGAGFQGWLDKLHETFIETGYYTMLLEGLGNTLLITLGALAIGVVIGTLIAVVKYFSEDTPGLKPLAWLCDTYVTVIRGVPVVVLLLIFYFIILTSADEMLVAVLTFGINSGAYMAELIRSGINAVDGGQMEAGAAWAFPSCRPWCASCFPRQCGTSCPPSATS